MIQAERERARGARAAVNRRSVGLSDNLARQPGQKLGQAGASARVRSVRTAPSYLARSRPQ